ncbi:titin-like isoform X4 [Planococcus citri]|uniref:titin-like isoform X4 n=1 Tax=Planococcus citri TaxID=170843 RepID=UPI0031F7D6DA
MSESPPCENSKPVQNGHPAVTINERTDNDIVLMVQLPDETEDKDIYWTRNNQRSFTTERYKPYNSRKKSSLMIRQLTLDDSGHYCAESEDSYGTSLLASIDLNVDKKLSEVPTFLKRLHDVSAKIGARSRFLVEIDGLVPFKVTWYRDNQLLRENERFTFLDKNKYYCLDIAWTTLQDEGHWTCIAENKYGCSVSSAYLTILVPKAYRSPQFVEDLRAILSEDGAVSLECKVIGVPTPTLLWYKDGKKIKAGDTFALRADSNDVSSLGTYSCVAKNCLGQAFSSSSVHIQKDHISSDNSVFPLGPRPKFIRELQNAEAHIEEPLTLSCQVVVPPWPKTIDWYNKNGKISEDSRYKLLADGLGMYGLEIKSVEMIDDGEWKCVATSFFGIKAYTSCYVTVKFPKTYKTPKFLENLQAVMTPEGLVSFECKVIGYPTPQLRWLKDGKELRPGDVYQLTGTNSLGSYCCIAKNSMGEIKSTTVLTLEDIQGQLTEEERLLIFAANQPPYFIKGLKSFEAKINEELEFSVQVSAKPDANVLWYRDDEPVELNERITTRKENYGIFVLHFKRLEMQDQAEWKCVAVNDYGQSVTSCFIKLSIPKHFKAPRFLEELKATFTKEGTVNLECKVIGVPQPELKWYKDGKHLKSGEMHKIISGGNGRCCLGTYACEATNCMATARSSASLLAFEEPKQINGIQRLNELDLLSIITEERTSQMNDVGSDKSGTYEEAVGPSFSFDGKEVSISLYETPDLTDEEALQIVEMYAEELTEHISDQNIIELPSLRFIKETVTSGNILMEATVIDMPINEFTGEEELKTDADVENSLMDDSAQAPSAIPAENLPDRRKEFSPVSESSQSAEKSGKSIITLEKIDVDDEDDISETSELENKSCTNKYSLLIKKSLEDDTLNDSSVTETVTSEIEPKPQPEKKIESTVSELDTKNTHSISDNLTMAHKKISFDSEDDSLHEFEKLKQKRKVSDSVQSSVEKKKKVQDLSLLLERTSEISPEVSKEVEESHQQTSSLNKEHQLVLESIASSVTIIENDINIIQHYMLSTNQKDISSEQLIQSVVEPITKIKNDIKQIQSHQISQSDYKIEELVPALTPSLAKLNDVVADMKKFSQSIDNFTLQRTSQTLLNAIINPIENISQQINLIKKDDSQHLQTKESNDDLTHMINELKRYTTSFQNVQNIVEFSSSSPKSAIETIKQMERVQKLAISFHKNSDGILPTAELVKFHNSVIQYFDTNIRTFHKLQSTELQLYLDDNSQFKTEIDNVLSVAQNTPQTSLNYLTEALGAYYTNSESAFKRLAFSNTCLRSLDDSVEIIVNSITTIEKCSEVEKSYQKKRILMTLCNLKIPLQDFLAQIRNISSKEEFDNTQIYEVINDVSIPLQLLRKEIGLLFHQSYSGQVLDLVTSPLKKLQDEISLFHDLIILKEPSEIDMDQFLLILNKLNSPFCELANKIMQAEDLVLQESPVVADPKLGIKIVLQSVSSLVDVLTSLQSSNHSTSLILSNLTNPLMEVCNSLKTINNQFYEEDLEKVNITMLKTLSTPFNLLQKQLIDVSPVLTGDLKNTVKELQRTILTIQDQVSFEYGDEPASIEYNIMTLQTLLHPINILRNHCVALMSEDGTAELLCQWDKQMKTIDQIVNILVSMDTMNAQAVLKLIKNYQSIIKIEGNNCYEILQQLSDQCNEIHNMNDFHEIKPFIRRIQDNFERITETKAKNIIERLLSSNEDFDNILHVLTTYKEEDNVKCFIALLQSLNIIRTLQESVKDTQTTSTTDSLQTPMLHSFLNTCERLESKISDLLYVVENSSARIPEFYSRTIDAFSTLNNQLVHLNKCLMDQSVSDDDQKEIPFESSIHSFNCLLAVVNSEENAVMAPIKEIIHDALNELVKLQNDILFNMSLIQSEDDVSLNESEFEETSLKPNLISVCYESMKKEILKCEEQFAKMMKFQNPQTAITGINTSLESISNIIHFISEHGSFDSETNVKNLNQPLEKILEQANMLENLSKANAKADIIVPQLSELSHSFENFKKLVDEVESQDKHSHSSENDIGEKSNNSVELDISIPQSPINFADDSLQSDISSSTEVSNITTVICDDEETIKHITQSTTPSSDLVTAIEKCDIESVKDGGSQAESYTEKTYTTSQENFEQLSAAEEIENISDEAIHIPACTNIPTSCEAQSSEFINETQQFQTEKLDSENVILKAERSSPVITHEIVVSTMDEKIDEHYETSKAVSQEKLNEESSHVITLEEEENLITIDAQNMMVVDESINAAQLRKTELTAILATESNFEEVSMEREATNFITSDEMHLNKEALETSLPLNLEEAISQSQETALIGELLEMNPTQLGNIKESDTEKEYEIAASKKETPSSSLESIQIADFSETPLNQKADSLSKINDESIIMGDENANSKSEQINSADLKTTISSEMAPLADISEIFDSIQSTEVEEVPTKVSDNTLLRTEVSETFPRHQITHPIDIMSQNLSKSSNIDNKVEMEPPEIPIDMLEQIDSEELTIAKQARQIEQTDLQISSTELGTIENLGSSESAIILENEDSLMIMADRCEKKMACEGIEERTQEITRTTIFPLSMAETQKISERQNTVSEMIENVESIQPQEILDNNEPNTSETISMGLAKMKQFPEGELETTLTEIEEQYDEKFKQILEKTEQLVDEVQKISTDGESIQKMAITTISPINMTVSQETSELENLVSQMITNDLKAEENLLLQEIPDHLESNSTMTSILCSSEIKEVPQREQATCFTEMGSQYDEEVKETIEKVEKLLEGVQNHTVDVHSSKNEEFIADIDCNFQKLPNLDLIETEMISVQLERSGDNELIINSEKTEEATNIIKSSEENNDENLGVQNITEVGVSLHIEGELPSNQQEEETELQVVPKSLNVGQEIIELLEQNTDFVQTVIQKELQKQTELTEHGRECLSSPETITSSEIATFPEVEQGFEITELGELVTTQLIEKDLGLCHTTEELEQNIIQCQKESLITSLHDGLLRSESSDLPSISEQESYVTAIEDFSDDNEALWESFESDNTDEFFNKKSLKLKNAIELGDLRDTPIIHSKDEEINATAQVKPSIQAEENIQIGTTEETLHTVENNEKITIVEHSENENADSSETISKTETTEMSCPLSGNVMIFGSSRDIFFNEPIDESQHIEKIGENDNQKTNQVFPDEYSEGMCPLSGNVMIFGSPQEKFSDEAVIISEQLETTCEEEHTNETTSSIQATEKLHPLSGNVMTFGSPREKLADELEIETTKLEKPYEEHANERTSSIETTDMLCPLSGNVMIFGSSKENFFDENVLGSEESELINDEQEYINEENSSTEATEVSYPLSGNVMIFGSSSERFSYEPTLESGKLEIVEQTLENIKPSQEENTEATNPLSGNVVVFSSPQETFLTEPIIESKEIEKPDEEQEHAKEEILSIESAEVSCPLSGNVMIFGSSSEKFTHEPALESEELETVEQDQNNMDIFQEENTEVMSQLSGNVMVFGSPREMFIDESVHESETLETANEEQGNEKTSSIDNTEVINYLSGNVMIFSSPRDAFSNELILESKPSEMDQQDNSILKEETAQVTDSTEQELAEKSLLSENITFCVPQEQVLDNLHSNEMKFELNKNEESTQISVSEHERTVTSEINSENVMTLCSPQDTFIDDQTLDKLNNQSLDLKQASSCLQQAELNQPESTQAKLMTLAANQLMNEEITTAEVDEKPIISVESNSVMEIMVEDGEIDHNKEQKVIEDIIEEHQIQTEKVATEIHNDDIHSSSHKSIIQEQEAKTSENSKTSAGNIEPTEKPKHDEMQTNVQKLNAGHEEVNVLGIQNADHEKMIEKLEVLQESELTETQDKKLTTLNSGKELEQGLSTEQKLEKKSISQVQELELEDDTSPNKQLEKKAQILNEVITEEESKKEKSTEQDTIENKRKEDKSSKCEYIDEGKHIEIKSTELDFLDKMQELNTTNETEKLKTNPESKISIEAELEKNDSMKSDITKEILMDEQNVVLPQQTQKGVESALTMCTTEDVNHSKQEQFENVQEQTHVKETLPRGQEQSLEISQKGTEEVFQEKIKLEEKQVESTSEKKSETRHPDSPKRKLSQAEKLDGSIDGNKTDKAPIEKSSNQEENKLKESEDELLKETIKCELEEKLDDGKGKTPEQSTDENWTETVTEKFESLDSEAQESISKGKAVTKVNSTKKIDESIEQSSKLNEQPESIPQMTLKSTEDEEKKSEILKSSSESEKEHLKTEKSKIPGMKPSQDEQKVKEQTEKSVIRKEKKSEDITTEAGNEEESLEKQKSKSLEKILSQDEHTAEKNAEQPKTLSEKTSEELIAEAREEILKKQKSKSLEKKSSQDEDKTEEQADQPTTPQEKTSKGPIPKAEDVTKSPKKQKSKSPEKNSPQNEEKTEKLKEQSVISEKRQFEDITVETGNEIGSLGKQQSKNLEKKHLPDEENSEEQPEQPITPTTTTSQALTAEAGEKIDVERKNSESLEEKLLQDRDKAVKNADQPTIPKKNSSNNPTVEEQDDIKSLKKQKSKSPEKEHPYNEEKTEKPTQESITSTAEVGNEVKNLNKQKSKSPEKKLLQDKEKSEVKKQKSKSPEKKVPQDKETIENQMEQLIPAEENKSKDLTTEVGTEVKNLKKQKSKSPEKKPLQDEEKFEVKKQKSKSPEKSIQDREKTEKSTENSTTSEEKQSKDLTIEVRNEAKGLKKQKSKSPEKKPLQDEEKPELKKQKSKSPEKSIQDREKAEKSTENSIPSEEKQEAKGLKKQKSKSPEKKPLQDEEKFELKKQKSKSPEKSIQDREKAEKSTENSITSEEKQSKDLTIEVGNEAKGLKKQKSKSPEKKPLQDEEKPELKKQKSKSPEKKPPQNKEMLENPMEQLLSAEEKQSKDLTAKVGKEVKNLKNQKSKSPEKKPLPDEEKSEVKKQKSKSPEKKPLQDEEKFEEKKQKSKSPEKSIQDREKSEKATENLIISEENQSKDLTIQVGNEAKGLKKQKSKSPEKKPLQDEEKPELKKQKSKSPEKKVPQDKEMIENPMEQSIPAEENKSKDLTTEVGNEAKGLKKQKSKSPEKPELKKQKCKSPEKKVPQDQEVIENPMEQSIPTEENKSKDLITEVGKEVENLKKQKSKSPEKKPLQDEGMSEVKKQKSQSPEKTIQDRAEVEKATEKSVISEEKKDPTVEVEKEVIGLKKQKSNSPEKKPSQDEEKSEEKTKEPIISKKKAKDSTAEAADDDLKNSEEKLLKDKEHENQAVLHQKEKSANLEITSEVISSEKSAEPAKDESKLIENLTKTAQKKLSKDLTEESETKIVKDKSKSPEKKSEDVSSEKLKEQTKDKNKTEENLTKKSVTLKKEPSKDLKTENKTETENMETNESKGIEKSASIDEMNNDENPPQRTSSVKKKILKDGSTTPNKEENIPKKSASVKKKKSKDFSEGKKESKITTETQQSTEEKLLNETEKPAQKIESEEKSSATEKMNESTQQNSEDIIIKNENIEKFEEISTLESLTKLSVEMADEMRENPQKSKDLEERELVEKETKEINDKNLQSELISKKGTLENESNDELITTKQDQESKSEKSDSTKEKQLESVTGNVPEMKEKEEELSKSNNTNLSQRNEAVKETEKEPKEDKQLKKLSQKKDNKSVSPKKKKSPSPENKQTQPVEEAKPIEIDRENPEITQENEDLKKLDATIENKIQSEKENENNKKSNTKDIKLKTTANESKDSSSEKSLKEKSPEKLGKKLTKRKSISKPKAQDSSPNDDQHLNHDYQKLEIEKTMDKNESKEQEKSDTSNEKRNKPPLLETKQGNEGVVPENLKRRKSSTDDEVKLLDNATTKPHVISKSKVLVQSKQHSKETIVDELLKEPTCLKTPSSTNTKKLSINEITENIRVREQRIPEMSHINSSTSVEPYKSRLSSRPYSPDLRDNLKSNHFVTFTNSQLENGKDHLFDSIGVPEIPFKHYSASRDQWGDETMKYDTKLTNKKQNLILDKYPKMCTIEKERFYTPLKFDHKQNEIDHNFLHYDRLPGSNSHTFHLFKENILPDPASLRQHNSRYDSFHQSREYEKLYDNHYEYESSLKYSQNLKNKDQSSFGYDLSQYQPFRKSDTSHRQDFVKHSYSDWNRRTGIPNNFCSSREIESILSRRLHERGTHSHIYFLDIIPMDRPIVHLDKSHVISESRFTGWDILPTFKRLCADNMVPVGATLALHAEVEGTPKPDVEWLREDQSLPKNLNRYRYIEDFGLHTLLITDVSYNEAGKYSCKAYNKYGAVNVITNVFVIRTSGIRGGKPPMFISRPETILSVNTGSDVSVSFRLSGDPRPKVIWMKGLTDITETHRTMKETVNDYTRLILKRAQLSDSGTYFIIAKNEYGTDRAFFTLRVNQRSRSLTPIPTYRREFSTTFESDRSSQYGHKVPGSIPSEPYVLDCGKNWLTLTWPKPKHCGGAPILAYRVECWLTGEDGGAKWTELGMTPSNTFEAFNLETGKKYNFRVTARNQYGWGEPAVTSSPILVEDFVTFPEFEKVLPGQLKVLDDSSIELECKVKNETGTQIEWHRDGVQLEETDTRKMTYENGRCLLKLDNVQENDSGRYVCEAFNKYGRICTFVRLMVVDDPKIVATHNRLNRIREGCDGKIDLTPQFTMRLRNRRVEMTYPVRLTCQVIGYPKPKIAWFKDGQSLHEDQHYSIYEEADGFQSLEICRSMPEHSGTYMITASNDSGSVSCKCDLLVDKGIRTYIEPKFIEKLDMVYSTVEDTQLRIKALVQAYPSVGITWQKNGIRLRPSRRIIVTLDHDGRTELTIANVKPQDSGIYTCTATNAIGSAETNTRIEVFSKHSEPSDSNSQTPDELYSKEPKFLVKPRSCKAHEGDHVIIECEIIGDPKPHVTWLRDRLKLEYYRDCDDFKLSSAGSYYQLEIPRARFDHTGAYTVTASNEHGETKALVSLQVYSKDLLADTETEAGMPNETMKYSQVEKIPKIKKHLSDIKCCDGDSATFECEIHTEGDTSNVDFRWYKNGRLIPLGNDFEAIENGSVAKLIIKHVYPEDEGRYSCIANNNLGNATTTACLIVDVPEEKENLLSRQLNRPSGVSRSRGSTPLSIPKDSSRTTSPADDASALRIGHRFRRRTAPKFYAVPHNKIAELGQTVRFQCALSGHPEPTTTWDKNDTVITPTSRISIQERDDLRILEIANITAEDEGLYRIVVENEVGRCEATARLDIMNHRNRQTNGTRTRTSDGSFSRHTIGKVANVGGKCTISCNVPDASSSTSTSWYKNGESLKTTQNITPHCDKTSARLQFDNLTTDDSGVYTCITENNSGLTRCSAELIVLDDYNNNNMDLQPPVFVTGLPPRSSTIEGNPFEFKIKLQGELPMQITWYKNGEKLPNCDDFQYIDHNNGEFSLRLNDVFLADSGSYKCEVYNCYGDATSTGQLAVQEEQPFIDKSPFNCKSILPCNGHFTPAIVTEGPIDMIALRGDTVSLKVTYAGDPEPSLRWIKAGRQLLPDKRISINTENGSSVLKIERVTADDGGKYEICAENVQGNDTHTTSLAVEGSPDAPKGQPNSVAGDRCATVTWQSPPYDGGSIITGYTIEMRSYLNSSWRKVMENCHSLFCTIRGLIPGESYIFRIRAENKHGLSNPSMESIPTYITHADICSPIEPKRVYIQNGETFKDHYEVLEELGKGRYGIVHKVRDKEFGNYYAAKFVRCIKSKDKEKVREEITIMNQLKHPKLLQLMAAYENVKEMMMVTEYISGGELFERVVADDFTLTERDCILFMKQICEGVAYIHKNNVVHLDLKPENIMCVSRISHQIKLIDFGLAQKISPDTPVRVLFGTPEFIPPEIINYEPIGTETDMWSVGVICYVLLSGLSPFMGENDAETFANITRADFDFDDEAFDAISDDARDFISSLLLKRKEKRLTAKQCLHHKWLAQHDKTMSCVKLCTDKLKKFIIRRKWQPRLKRRNG